MTKGVILAGGSGTRLFPLTLGCSKQLMPVFDKPMIYYPISVLMLAGIREIAIITNPHETEAFKRLLGTGDKFGVEFTYLLQEQPNGIAESFIIAEEFIATDSVCLVLGDNIFYGAGFSPKLLNAANQTQGATIFGYQVKDPERFGIVEVDEDFNALSIEEKPQHPKSDYAVTGLYFYDNRVVDIAKSIGVSERGELEISCVNQIYLDQQSLRVEILGRGFAWLDTGTHNSLMEAGQFVQTVEHRQGFKIACLEEIGFINGWLNQQDLQKQAEVLGKSDYGKYLNTLIK